MKELEVRGARSSTGETVEASFYVSKHIKFVPTFSETEVDKYFLNQACAWFIEITSVRMYACVCVWMCVCVSAPEAINN